MQRIPATQFHLGPRGKKFVRIEGGIRDKIRTRKQDKDAGQGCRTRMQDKDAEKNGSLWGIGPTGLLCDVTSKLI